MIDFWANLTLLTNLLIKSNNSKKLTFIKLISIYCDMTKRFKQIELRHGIKGVRIFEVIFFLLVIIILYKLEEKRE